METVTADVGILVKRFPKLSETFIAGEVSELQRQGINLRVLSIWRPNEQLVHETSRGLSKLVTYLDEAVVSASNQLSAANLELSYLSGLDPSLKDDEQALVTIDNLTRLISLIRQFRLKHLHVHYLGQSADLASCASRITDVSFSISAHAKDVYKTAPKRIRARLADSALLATCTEHNLDYLSKLAPEYQHKIALFKHGIDTEYFRPISDAPRRRVSRQVPLILGVGRYKYKKGFDVLIRACALLARRRIQFECEIVGYGDQADNLMMDITEHGLTGKVHLREPATQDGIRDLMRGAAVFVLPCRIAKDGDRDGIPNSVLEAMACGLPVISTTVSGVPEVITSNENGLLVEPDNPAGLAEALEEVLGNQALATRLGASARLSVSQRFNWQSNVSPLAKALRKFVSTSRSVSSTP